MGPLADRHGKIASEPPKHSKPVTRKTSPMQLLAQNYSFAYILIILMVLLGLLAICVPRLRKGFKVAERKKVQYKRPRIQRQ